MPRHDPRVSVTQMRDAAQKAIRFLGNKERASFESDERDVFAVVHCLEILGEAARRVPMEVQLEHAEVPWAGLIGLRNKLSHGYDTINKDAVWKTITQDVPALLPILEKLLRALR